MSDPLFSVKGLRKCFPIYSGILRRKTSEIVAVDGIDFTIEKGEVLGLVGESGSGKSTAARAAVRLIEPTAGTLLFEGKDISMYSRKELKGFRKEAQIIFQDPYASLNPRQSIGDSIGEGLKYHRMADSKKELEKAIVHIMEQVGLTQDFRSSYPHELSGGQQQRVCIGRAIAMKPKLLICDEAVSALDVSVQAQILNLLIQLRDEMGITLLFITHDLSVVKFISDRIAVMEKGKIVETNTSEELFASPKHSYTIKLLSAIPSLHPRKKSSV